VANEADRIHALLHAHGVRPPTKRSVRQGRARLAGEDGRIAGGHAARAGQLPGDNRSAQPANSGPGKQDETLRSGRSPRAVAAQHSGLRRLLGTGAFGRDRTDRALRQQAATLQLRRADPAPAAVGGPKALRGHHPRGLAPVAVDPGGGGNSGRALFSRRPAILPATTPRARLIIC